MDSLEMDIDKWGLITEADDLGESNQMDTVKASEYSPPESSIIPKCDLSKEELHKFFKDATMSFFNEWGLISHQLNSFNEFVDHGIHRLFDSLGEFHVYPDYNPSRKGLGGWRHAVVKFGKVRIDKPSFCDEKGDSLPLTPTQARLQNLTYSSRIHAEVYVKVYEEEVRISEKYKTGKGQYPSVNVISEATNEVLIGRLPVMVNSNLCCLGFDKRACDYDYGGYFIIKGSEKTFIAQEHRCLKRIWVSGTPICMASYIPDEMKRKRIYVKVEETPKRSSSEGKVITIFFLYAVVPVWIMFFALGASSDREIVEMIGLDISDTSLSNILLSTIHAADEACDDFRRSSRAQEYLQGLIKNSKFPPDESIDECINKYLFPSLQGYRKKALFLGYMVKCLLLSYFGRRKYDNKDDFKNKRLELCGELLERELLLHIRNAGRRMIKAMQRDLSKDLKPLDNYFDASIVTNSLYRAFATGGWSHPFRRNERCSGVVATLRRTNPLQTVSDMRKTRLQVQYTGKIGDARYPNPSFWGKICFLSTPDGENCGLVKNLAVTGLVSTRLVDLSVDKLVNCGMEEMDDNSLSLLSGRFKVLLNGLWVGLCEDSITFVDNLRNLRRRLMIDPQVEIKRDQQQMEIRIFSDVGRILRPLLIVENNELRVSREKIEKFKSKNCSFQYLLEEGIIEFIGVEEEEDCKAAWRVENLQEQSYTHCELDLSFLLGLSCGIIPFANHNFARRVLYQSEKHSQQAIGFCTTNHIIRVDTLSHHLYYPQKPLFRSMISDCLGKPEFFNGQNAVVAVNVHLGYNQEDSLVLNETSLQRGMFRTEHFRSYKSEVDITKGIGKRLKMKEKVDFGKPLSGYGKVDRLDDDGFPYIAACLEAGDVVIGKVGETGNDYSIKLKHTEKGVVQKVVLSANDEGKNFAVVSLRQVRSPCLGDKFSSMHGQKGVVGFLESQENFPFTREGIVPDIVINPHAFPTRQTPGQLLESALGKGIACGGPVRYATPYAAASVDDITKQLHSLGYSKWGTERVYNGTTGQALKNLIFVGPTFYQRLIHMAEDKVKFRNTGPVHPLTRQPVADRKRYGGVKFGEMERDCLLAHGAAANLQERLFILSDFSQMFICQKCSRVANVVMRGSTDRKVRGPYCPFCKSIEHIVKINVPYGAKLLYQELFSMGICLKFTTELA